MHKTSIKKSFKKKSPKKTSLKLKCRKYLSKKIGINMAEYKKGRWSNKKQAIAVSISETKKKFPQCSKYFIRKSLKKSKK